MLKIFDALSNDAISFLQAHPVVSEVDVQDRPCATQAQVEVWEAQNKPFKLPDDYKAFLAISDGVTVRWSLRLKEESKPFGLMHINPLEEVTRLKFPESASAAFPLPDAGGAGTDRKAAAFDLDAECIEGRVALLYRPGRQPEVNAAGTLEPWERRPEVWFQDLSCRWNFLASSFNDYFRLLFSHLGVPQWQYAFTTAGMAPAAQHWLAFFCPERSALAAEQRSQQAAPDGRRARRRANKKGTEPPRRGASRGSAGSGSTTMHASQQQRRSNERCPTTARQLVGRRESF